MMRVLALVPGDIDNQILFFPTFETLQATYPGAQIDVVAEARAVPAYRICKAVHKVMRFEFSELNSFADWSNLLGQMRDQDYDVVLCAATRWSMGLALWMSGIQKRIGFSGSGASFSLTQSVPLRIEQYLAQTYHDLLLGLGIKAPCPALSITVSDKDLEWAKAECQRLGIESSGYLLIDDRPSANAQGSYPRYPIAQWQVFIQSLQQRQPNLPIVLVQSPASEVSTPSLESIPGLKVSTLEEVGKLAGLIKGARSVLCIENATLQLAVALEVPLVALLDGTTSAVMLPDHDLFVGIRAATGKIADIQPQAVVDVVKKVLQNH